MFEHAIAIIGLIVGTCLILRIMLGAGP